MQPIWREKSPGGGSPWENRNIEAESCLGRHPIPPRDLGHNMSRKISLCQGGVKWQDFYQNFFSFLFPWPIAVESHHLPLRILCSHVKPSNISHLIVNVSSSKNPAITDHTSTVASFPQQQPADQRAPNERGPSWRLVRLNLRRPLEPSSAVLEIWAHRSSPINRSGSWPFSTAPRAPSVSPLFGPVSALLRHALPWGHFIVLP